MAPKKSKAAATAPSGAAAKRDRRGRAADAGKTKAAPAAKKAASKPAAEGKAKATTKTTTKEPAKAKAAPATKKSKPAAVKKDAEPVVAEEKPAAEAKKSGKSSSTAAAKSKAATASKSETAASTETGKKRARATKDADAPAAKRSKGKAAANKSTTAEVADEIVAAASTSEPVKKAKTAAKKATAAAADAMEDVVVAGADSEPAKKVKKAARKGAAVAADAAEGAVAAADSEPAKKVKKAAKKASAVAADVADDAVAAADSEPAKKVKKAAKKGAAVAADVASEAVAAADSEPAKKAKSTAKKATSAAIAAVAPPTTGYWLMKAEPESRMETTASGKEVDIKFSIDDLEAKNGPEPWDGIRNFVARNNLRAMEIGDKVLFSESNVKQPGLVGTMEVVGLARPDPSQFDKDSPYYDPKSKESDPKWSMVLVEFRSKFHHKLTSNTLKKHAGEGGPLRDLQLFKQSRLSVQRVEVDEWDFIMRLVSEQSSDPIKKSQPKTKKPKAQEKVVPSVEERQVTPPRPSFLGRIADVLTSPVRAVSRALSGTPAPGGEEKVKREGSGLAAVPEE